MTELSHSLNATSSSSHGVHEQLSKLQRALAAAESEKQILEDRLETGRQATAETKHAQDMMADRVARLQDELQRSESRANQLELQLQSSKSHLETGNAGADNYLREELGRMRKESTQAQEKIKELRKTVRAIFLIIFFLCIFCSILCPLKRLFLFRSLSSRPKRPSLSAATSAPPCAALAPAASAPTSSTTSAPRSLCCPRPRLPGSTRRVSQQQPRAPTAPAQLR